MKIHMIMLAAGNSCRFGRNKLLYKIEGKEMYQHLVDKLADVERRTALAGKKVVVSQYEEIFRNLSSRGYLTAFNGRPDLGISHSVQLGMDTLLECGDVKEEDGVCFFVCDQPYLKADTIFRFFEAFAAQKKYGIGCLSHGGKMGNPVIFKTCYAEKLRSLSGDQGGRQIIKRHMEDVFLYEVKEALELEDLDRRKELVIVRGGGDIASGTVWHLFQNGYRVLVLETDSPACIRRQVAFSEAVYEGRCQVDGVTAIRIDCLDERLSVWEENAVPVLVDPEGKSIEQLQPAAVVDGILAKKNLGTHMDMAEVTIGLGPGFEASVDVDYVVETMRGEDLGKIYEKGTAIPNTGVPGIVGGYSRERVIHAPAEGRFAGLYKIGDIVKRGEVIARVGDVEVKATLDGILRGMIREGYPAAKGLKIMDIDPRQEEGEQIFHISDKAHKIGESVLEIIRSHTEE